MIEKINGASIFVSHSSRDWIKVREIRNFLEDQGHYPLLFHLKCLEDEDEINELLKREIQARNWFVLCDSDNARSSQYVSNEIEYIKSLDDKVFEIIDLQKEVDSQLDKLVRLSKRATIYMSYSQKDQETANRIIKVLRDNDYQVFNVVEDLTPGEVWETEINNEIENAIKNGFFIQLITENYLKSKYTRAEFQKAIDLRHKYGLKGNIMPLFFIDELSLLELLPEELQNFMRRIQYADFSKGSLEDNINNFVKQLKIQEMD